MSTTNRTGSGLGPMSSCISRARKLPPPPLNHSPSQQTPCCFVQKVCASAWFAMAAPSLYPSPSVATLGPPLRWSPVFSRQIRSSSIHRTPSPAADRFRSMHRRLEAPSETAFHLRSCLFYHSDSQRMYG